MPSEKRPVIPRRHRKGSLAILVVMSIAVACAWPAGAFATQRAAQREAAHEVPISLGAVRDHALAQSDVGPPGKVKLASKVVVAIGSAAQKVGTRGLTLARHGWTRVSTGVTARVARARGWLATRPWDEIVAFEALSQSIQWWLFSDDEGAPTVIKVDLPRE